MPELDSAQPAAPAARPARVRARGAAKPAALAETDPVARVVVDVGLAHLDRPFDYAVPAAMAEQAVPGALVRVRFAGADVEGYVLERAATTEHHGRLTPLRRVVSGLPVVSPQVLRLARAVAERYAGTLGDVLRLAVPGRHAGAEAEVLAAPPAQPPQPAVEPAADPGDWRHHQAGAAFLDHVRAGRSPRAVATLAPGSDWADALAVAARACLDSGRGALLVVPDHRDLDLLDAALTRRLPAGSHVRLEAEAGPAARYRAFVRALTGRARVVAGTRAAALAPVADLGLVVVWDDGDDLHAEQRAPYPHVREVAALRAEQDGAAALVAGWSRTAEGQLLLESGWAREVVATRAAVRERMPRVLIAGAGGPGAQDPLAAAARLPSDGWRAVRTALTQGPVLVQVPRTGYVPSLACDTCRAPARCGSCAGPLGLPEAGEVAACRWCGRPAADWHCPRCEGRRQRAVVTGARRTAEELGRAFPGVPVRTSGGTQVLARVGPQPALVVCTPGAEPVAEGGYAGALLLDGWALLQRPDLRAGEEALRRWMAAAALVRPAGAGGVVALVADPQAPPAQALVRWDPGGHAARELAERRELGLPPAARLAGLIGEDADVREALDGLPRPPGWRVLGPVPVPVPGRSPGAPELVRAVVEAPLAEGGALAAEVKALLAGRSARKLPVVRARIDPLDIG
ncbi:replication restart DNA helicase PriA [Kineococcus xinjiangensis]|uniref:Probable replication restart protein PriA n=1 Tax=Kineococcus xinjiangensis TaxID=512762 RepID=A0A2S6IPB6_9ACTN|nr:primosomal protein N' [Kineococcus xinjiangensis]PPK96048.1 replication restart DNA helicase PriA [Kineococcus xinjiangensis]